MARQRLSPRAIIVTRLNPAWVKIDSPRRLVLTAITPVNDIYREVLFGPVAQVYRVPSEEAAVTLANDTPFGLGSYVMTNDLEQAERVADRIDAGMVYVNIVGADAAETPFGGTKRSGFGRELGRYGADEFVNKKLIRIS